MAACRDCHNKNLNVNILEEKKKTLLDSRKPLLSIEYLHLRRLFRNKENASL